MKKHTIWTLVTLVTLSLSVPAFAGSDHGGGMQGGGMKGMQMKGMDMKGSMPMMGKEIRTTQVNGYTLTYRLIDMKQKMEMMKGMKGMSMKGMDMSKMKSHHLMVFVKGADGKPVADAKAGFKVEGPSGAQVPVQKVMCMAMSGGFGADVDFKAKGTYTIKAKVVAGDTKLVDEFTYTVE